MTPAVDGRYLFLASANNSMPVLNGWVKLPQVGSGMPLRGPSFYVLRCGDRNYLCQGVTPVNLHRVKGRYGQFYNFRSTWRDG